VRRFPLSRRRAGLALGGLLLVAAAITACDAGVAPAATVNGHAISAASVRDDLSAEVAAAKKAAQPGQPAQTPQVRGQGDGTFKTSVAVGKVSSRILDELLREELRRRRIEPTGADRTEAAKQLCGGTAGCLDSYPSSYKNFITGFGARYIAFSRTVRSSAPAPQAKSQTQLEADAQAQYDQALAQQPDQLNQVCYVVALVPDAATGETLKATVTAGADFATVAAAIPGVQVNATPRCVPQSSEPQPLANVAPGALIGPLADQSGQVVVQVTKRGQATFADIKDQLVQSLRQQDRSQVQQQAGQAQQQDVQRALVKVAAKADVTVDPKFGTWDPKRLDVVAPKVPKGVTVTTLPAAGAPTGQG